MLSARCAKGMMPVRKWIGLGLALVAACLGVEAFWFEPRRLTVTELDVRTPSWPHDTRPLRAVLISDLHVGGWHMPPERVRFGKNTLTALPQ